MVSMRGNWPLVPTMDVVVPHTRILADLFEVLDILVVDDVEERGDFWRVQPWVGLPRASSVRREHRRRRSEAEGSRPGRRSSSCGRRPAATW